MSLVETLYRLKGYNLKRIEEEINILRRLPAKELSAWQNEKKWNLVETLYRNNPFYREKLGTEIPGSWEDLPIVTKSDLQRDIHGLISSNYRLGDLYVNNTSGSSGHPLIFAKTYYTQARVWAYKKLFAEIHGIDYFTSMEAKFYGMPKSFKSRMVQHLKDRILNRERFVVFEMNEKVFAGWVERFRRRAFDYIYGYTSSIVLFCRYLLEKGIVLNRICPTLKVVIVTSEVCSPEDREIIRKATGVEARNEYGTADAGLIGYECTEGRIHLCEENVFVERDRDGSLLVTDLFNDAFPLVRYQVGDMAEISDHSCACGTHDRVIESLQGRTNDVAILRSGKMVPGLTFYYISRALLESSGVLREFIIRQTSPDTFEFDVVSDGPLSPADIAELEKTAEEYLEPGLNIVVNQVEKIERPASGKIKHFYSELET